MVKSPKWMLLELHTNALGAVKQPSQMEAGERVLGMQADQRGKCRHCRGVSGFKFRERLGILLRQRSLEGTGPYRLVSTERLGAPAQHKITDRPAPEFLGLRHCAA